MCGIAGILSLRGAPPTLHELAVMNRLQAHRGPDGEGAVVIGPCGLAHRRLAVIGLGDEGAQPMASDDGRLTLSYNGELYNHVELRAELEQLGHRFRSHTDTEVVLAALKAWGHEAFERFNGMWALALWDASRKQLLLSRDRFGIKPLYVRREPDRVLFASEVKAIAALASERTIDRASVARFLLWDESVFVDRGFLTGIEPLPTATTVTLDPDGEQAHRYWTPPGDRMAPQDLPSAAAAVHDLLVDATRLRFRSDVPVGTCLSGGLDSSSIVAVAHHHLGQAPSCFSALYDERGFDEGRFVHAMTDRFDLDTHEVRPSGDDLPDVLAALAWFQDGPVTATGAYTQWHVMKAAAAHVKVLLDGQGADELFGGYDHYLTPALLSRAAQTPRDALSLVGDLRAVGRRLGRSPLLDVAETQSKVAWWRRVAPALRRSPVGPWALDRGGPRAARWLLPGVLSPALGDVLDEHHVWPSYRSRGRRRLAERLEAELQHDVLRGSVPALLHYEDRNAMAFSVEARVPFLDHRIVELAFKLPPRTKIEGSNTKIVLREAMRGLLPEDVRARRDKLGYPTPARAWFVRHGGWLRDLLCSRVANQRGFTRPDAVRRVIDQHLTHEADHSWLLFRLASLELFAQAFVDDKALAPPPAPVQAGASSSSS